MKKIQVLMVLEMLGRPKEHLMETMKLLLERLQQEKGVSLLEQNTREPVLVKDTQDLFTTFSEVTLEINDFSSFFTLIFTYLPSHVEIITPERLEIRNTEFNDLANKLVLRMHDYDAITKKAVYESQLYQQKLREVAPHLFSPPKSAQAQNSKEPLPKKTKSTSRKKSKK